MNNETNVATALMTLNKVIKFAAVKHHAAGEKNDIQSRYQERHAHWARRKQANIESITSKSLALCDERTSDATPDPDWIMQFMAMAEEIHQPDMQQLWATILADECAKPGQYSLKALQTLKAMTRRDARLFQQFCRLTSVTSGDDSRKVIFALSVSPSWHQLFSKRGNHKLSLNQYAMPYSSILWLMELGLVFNTELETSALTGSQAFTLTYAQEQYAFKVNSAESRLLYYRLTPIGDELARLLPPDPHREYRAALFGLLEKGMRQA